MPTTVSALKLGFLGKVKSEQALDIELAPREIEHIHFGKEDHQRIDSIATTIRDSDTVAATYPTRPTRLDPEEYQYARKKLKRAMQEHYRCVLQLLLAVGNPNCRATICIYATTCSVLEVLNNYRAGLFLFISTFF
jgi:hypothetical protein